MDEYLFHENRIKYLKDMDKYKNVHDVLVRVQIDYGISTKQALDLVKRMEIKSTPSIKLPPINLYVLVSADQFYKYKQQYEYKHNFKRSNNGASKKL